MSYASQAAWEEAKKEELYRLALEWHEHHTHRAADLHPIPCDPICDVALAIQAARKAAVEYHELLRKELNAQGLGWEPPWGQFPGLQESC